MKAMLCFAALACGLLAVPAYGQVCDGVSPVEASGLTSIVVDSGYTGRPLLVTAPPGDTDRIFIVEQNGKIHVKQRGTPAGTHSVYLDLTATVTSVGNEQGLLGMTFAADFATSRLFHVSYTAPGGAGVTTLATYQQSLLNPNKADPVPVATFFTLSQPQSNHNGGNVVIGGDGFLYFGLGDGGGANDSGGGHAACGNGQSDTTLFGKIIRIDPSGSSPNPPDCGTGSYTIPNGNPLADGPGGDCDEIWATGVRNPWRFAFDDNNDDLYIADVGQNCYEEVNWIPGSSTGGENYGWRVMEGAHCFNPANPGNCNSIGVVCAGSPNCNDPSLTIPVLEVPRPGITCSITGGYPYRGCRVSNLQGHYFWGDFCDGEVRSFLMNAGVATMQTNWTSTVDPGGTLLFSLTSFGLDGQGEIYIVDRDGPIRMLIPPLPDFEVSGEGVIDPEYFKLCDVVDWSWEDLALNSMHPIDFYSVYRGTPGGVFDCIHSTTGTTWTGDLTPPGVGQVLAYLVTATNADGDETSGGDGRILNLACAAPPP